MELIKIEKQVIGEDEVNAVDARELHEVLESKQEFANWIKDRINKYEFTEGVDFASFDKIITRETGATKRKEYFLSIDMAKELAMVERNDKGKQARQYFIGCEKKLVQVTQSSNPMEHLLTAPRSELLLEMANLAKETERLEAKVIEDRPKVEFNEAVIEAAHRTYSLSEAAKLIEQVAYAFGCLMLLAIS